MTPMSAACEVFAENIAYQYPCLAAAMQGIETDPACVVEEWQAAPAAVRDMVGQCGRRHVVEVMRARAAAMTPAERRADREAVRAEARAALARRTGGAPPDGTLVVTPPRVTWSPSGGSAGFRRIQAANDAADSRRAGGGLALLGMLAVGAYVLGRR